MNEIHIDEEMFWRRYKKLSKQLEKPLMVLLGKTQDVQKFTLNSAIFHYLLGYEFSETILIIKEDPIAITSPKKAEILRPISGIQIIIRNKEDVSMSSIFTHLTDKYIVVDSSKLVGSFSNLILKNTKWEDRTEEVRNFLVVKDKLEIDYMEKCGLVANYLMQKGIGLIRDLEFSKSALEKFTYDYIRGVDPAYIEYAYDPIYTPNSLKLGIRYKGYCTEIGRKFLSDTSLYYEVQSKLLSSISPGIDSFRVIEIGENYMKEKGCDERLEIYTIGLQTPERSFRDGFVLEKNTCFCINIGDFFVNTYHLLEIPEFITKKDTSEEYMASRMRFRNKNNDVAVLMYIKDHQKELLEKLIESQIQYYRCKETIPSEKKETVQNIEIYHKYTEIPRSTKIVLDRERLYVIVPVGVYSVPFHISMIKNVSLSSKDMESWIRINFRESREVASALELISKDSMRKDTTLRSMSVKGSENEIQELILKINEMKKEFTNPKIEIKGATSSIVERPKKLSLKSLYIRTDNKSGVPKTQHDLELHMNGFRYSGTVILFSNIKNIFYLAEGPRSDRAILHINMKKQVVFNGKLTTNIQFMRKLGQSIQNISKKRTDLYNERFHEENEELEIQRTNNDFLSFCTATEEEMKTHIQIPKRGFYGVYYREAVEIMVTSECLVSITEQPFFCLNFDEIEIVNLERVTFITKMFDCVFVLKDKTKMPITVTSVETVNLLYIKELLDSHNIVFIETKININWPNLLGTIMKDPLNFYESGGWSELLREEDDDEEAEASSNISTESSDESVSSTTESDDTESDIDSSDAKSDEEYDSDITEDETSSEEEVKSKRAKRR